MGVGEEGALEGERNREEERNGEEAETVKRGRERRGGGATHHVEERVAVEGLELHVALARHRAQRREHRVVDLVLGGVADAAGAVGADVDEAVELLRGALERVVHAVERKGDVLLRHHPRQPRQVGRRREQELRRERSDAARERRGEQVNR